MGKIQIFHMSPPTLPGLAGRPRYEFAGKDLNLPIDPTKPQDAPHVLSLTRCGNFLSCGTPKLGYYFTWDISWGEPRIMTNRQLRFFEV